MNVLSADQLAEDDRIAALAREHEAMRAEQGVERLQPVGEPESVKSITYLTSPPAAKRMPIYVEHGIGVMWTPNMGNKPNAQWPSWAVDNGCFTQPDRYSEDAYLAKLHTIATDDALPLPLFATAPDEVGDAVATLTRAADGILDRIRATGVPSSFVAQNGAERTLLPWEHFDCLFLGGSPECSRCDYVRPAKEFQIKACPQCGARLTEWKTGAVAQRLTHQAKERGKTVHMGRVNSCERLLIAASWGCDSADGTFVGFGPDKNLPQVIRWLREARALAA